MGHHPEGGLIFLQYVSPNWYLPTVLDRQSSSDTHQLYWIDKVHFLTLLAPCLSESCIKIKINLNSYFHLSLWCRKRFFEDLKGVHKTFSGTTKKCENKNLSKFSLCAESGEMVLIKYFLNFSASNQKPEHCKLQRQIIS